MKVSSSLDRLTVILSPVLSDEERERAALEHCGGSLTEGDGRGNGYGEGGGDGYGDVWGYGDGAGDGMSSVDV